MSTPKFGLMLIASAIAMPLTATADGLFHPPQRLEADGQVIDTGKAWGHCGPCIEDLDGDGLADLIVGDFGGTFHVYRNVGTPTEPKYESQGKLQAGGADAEVRIYCCVGSQPRFADLDGDGLRDLIANSYDPGHCYFFRRTAATEFAPREELKDIKGVPIRSTPEQQQEVQSFGSFFMPLDWDADGDIDLLIGTFEGGLLLRKNEGDPKTPSFASKNEVVEAAGKPLKVAAHCCPTVADWDGDGVWDLVVGSDDGSVTWFRNTGSLEEPRFAEGVTLVEKHEGSGYNLLRWSDSEVTPGIRSQVEVVDHNGDGKLDLLVGDFCTAYALRDDLSEEEKQAVHNLVKESETIGKEFGGKVEALREDITRRYPGEKMYSDEAQEEWSKGYEALRESDLYRALEAQEAAFGKKMRSFLADSRSPGDRRFDLAKSHGYVWVYLRK
jgi:hypothetical protein